MISTNMSFLKWCLNWSPLQVGRNSLLKTNRTVLNRPTMSGEQINYNHIGNNKVATLPDMVPPKYSQGARKFINVVKL